MDIELKSKFLNNEFVYLLEKLKGNEVPNWGKLNPIQMIEHFADAVNLAAGSYTGAIITPPEKLEAMRVFMLSDKDFKPNTPNKLMPEVPAPARSATVEEGILLLKAALINLGSYFESNPTALTINPFFGNLSYSDNIQLLHKHALHHLRQFGLI
ncbi:MAG: hypothetical protein RIQ89_1140 [Bacteroidota bacterium]|jgi:hypothetical protein